ncbi:alpha-L-rhamnosidase [Rhizobium sp. RU36D]|uniref:alpha-L-rhamnosidase n=1 Tax=Rhizobium sp. RU36D TaxID=1907415 RepID=UPI0009D85C47|nr:alpha-L-rhamnosidase [Rhizobium sp. RU36D]SMD00008.1 alpha-L-rhamnosidase [Rhizobium sp. RU36D]
MQPYDLKCEHLAVARGLNTPVPRFSWALRSGGGGQRQTAYRLVVGTDEGAVAKGSGYIWDSGKIVSDRTSLIPYGGPVLPDGAKLFWSVAVWDEADRSSVSAPATLFTGLAADRWRAQWIARYFVLPAGREVPSDNIYDNKWQARPADYLRKHFTAAKPRQALLYVTALGLYEAYINGVKIGDDVMAPGWTDYHRRVEYQVHDVTETLRDGDNVIGAILGEGWYSGRVGHNQRRAGNHYGGRPALLCELHLHHQDGSVEVIASDDSWQTRQGPICYSDFLMGEQYDARLAIDGWSEAANPPGSWQPVEAFLPDPRPPELNAARIQPAREQAEFAARFLHRSASGAAIYDLGQNISGYMKLEVTAREGDRFTLRHAEILDGDGELYTANLRHAVATDIFIAAGKGRESFKPRFTFHGFRYVELSVPDGFDLADVTLTGIAIHTDAPVTGRIETGNALVNQLLSNIEWSQRDNFLSVPTDCPQRDERYGWTADAQVFWRTAGYTMDVAAFLTKWMLDIEDGQSPDGAFPDVAPTKPLNPYRLTPQPGAPGWGDAPVIMGWQHYLRYGDRALLERFYPAFQRWMQHIETANPDGIRRNAVYNNYGDWLSIGPSSDRTVVATAYWVFVADLMERIAAVLGLEQDRARYAQLATRIRAAFQAEFVTADGLVRGDTQTAYLLSLDFDILPAELRPLAARRLVDNIRAAGNHLQTGFLGVKHLCPVLSDIGETDLAFQLLLNETYPSWGFSIAEGATTIWERWDGWTRERGFQSANMNSFNHYAYGSVGEWIWSRIAGIDWDESTPGFRRCRMRPLFDARIGWCKADYQAQTGLFRSHWSMEAETVRWEIEIPPNCEGLIELPSNARWVDGGQTKAGKSLLLPSGIHRLTIALAPGN